jgi:hypothetical protein
MKKNRLLKNETEKINEMKKVSSFTDPSSIFKLKHFSSTY